MRPPRLLAAKLQQLVDRIDPQAGRYRMLFESSPLPMWVVDDETLGFLAVNDAAVRLYGYSRQEFLAMRAEGFVPRTRSGNVFRGVFRHPRKGGEPLDVDAVGHLVGWRGRPARLVVINDISERVRAQAALRALSRRLLEIQEEERGRLARDLHDDIGQALTALKIQVESLHLLRGECRPRLRQIPCGVRHTPPCCP
jgi:signal transduction histidine kinase